jgi:hypothetical protein
VNNHSVSPGSDIATGLQRTGSNPTTIFWGLVIESFVPTKIFTCISCGRHKFSGKIKILWGGAENVVALSIHNGDI